MRAAVALLLLSVAALTTTEASSQPERGMGPRNPVVVAMPLTPHAQEPPGAQQRMRREMRTYFRGELELAAIALGLSAGSGYVGGWLLARATDATRAASIPVLTVGVAQLAIGIGLFARTGAQVDALHAQIGASPGAYATDEGERMDAVVSRFALFRTIEALLLVGGAGTASLGAVLDEDLAIGAGLGLGAQAGVVLVLDSLAEQRAGRYLDNIRQFHVSPTVVTTEQGRLYGVSIGSAF